MSQRVFFRDEPMIFILRKKQCRGRWAGIVVAKHAVLSMHVDHMHVDHGSSCRSDNSGIVLILMFLIPTIEEHVQPRFNGGKYRS